jgi:hypothetical protein
VLWFELGGCSSPSLLRALRFSLVAISLLLSGFALGTWISYGQSWISRLGSILKRVFNVQLEDAFMILLVMIVGFIYWQPFGDICSSLMKNRLLLLFSHALVALLNFIVFHSRAIITSDSQSLVKKWALPFTS